MYRIIGLWNDEEKYQDTPHNIGGQVLSQIFRNKESNILANSSNMFFSKTRNSNISEGEYDTGKSIKNFEVILPKTFMNSSGDAFNGEFEKTNKKQLQQSIEEIKKIVVLYDDIALPFGEVKISFGRGDGGHNGVKDIIKKLGTKNFVRVRIGVCPLDFFGKPRKPKKGTAVTNYLTKRTYSRKQIKMLENIEEKVKNILEEIIKKDYKQAMNIFN